MTRRGGLLVAFWSLVLVAVWGSLWWRIAKAKEKLDGFDRLVADCGLLQLGMDEASVKQIMGAPAGRYTVESSTPGVAAVLLQYTAGFDRDQPWAKLDGVTGRLVETACTKNFHLKAGPDLLHSLRQQSAGVGVGTDAARP